MMPFSLKTVLRFISYWPPFFFTGVKVLSFNKDITEVRVGLKTNFWNQNYFGTHYGGTLFSMCDPFFVFILADKLKKEHILWDLSSSIEYIKAVREPVEAVFSVSLEQIEEIKKQALESFNYKPEFEVEIKTKSGEVVAKVKKTLYVRRKDSKERFSLEASK